MSENPYQSALDVATMSAASPVSTKASKSTPFTLPDGHSVPFPAFFHIDLDRQRFKHNSRTFIHSNATRRSILEIVTTACSRSVNILEDY